MSENVDTNDKGCLGAAWTKEPDDVHFDRKGMSNREKERTNTLTHPAHGLCDDESEYCLQNWEMALSVLVSINFNESVRFCDLITVVCYSNNKIIVYFIIIKFYYFS